jgi:hypothetical protein
MPKPAKVKGTYMKTAVKGPMKSRSWNVGWGRPMACASRYSDVALSSMEAITEAVEVFADLRSAVLSWQTLYVLSQVF